MFGGRFSGVFGGVMGGGYWGIDENDDKWGLFHIYIGKLYK